MTLTLVLITLLSISLAGAMSLIAWRAARNERRRSEARVAVLAAELEDISTETPSSLEFDSDYVGASVDPSFSSGVLQSGDMFAADQTAEAHSRTTIAVAAGSVIVASVVIVVVLLSTIGKPSASATAAHAETPPDLIRTAPAERVPDAAQPAVELVALGHHRDDDRRLTVEGVVRNPATGTWVPHLSAVVLMFNSVGTLVATERTPVESSDLEPGAASRFAVSVPGSDIVRYRVSFRTDEHVVPHVDKRNGL